MYFFKFLDLDMDLWLDVFKSFNGALIISDDGLDVFEGGSHGDGEEGDEDSDFHEKNSKV